MYDPLFNFVARIKSYSFRPIEKSSFPTRFEPAMSFREFRKLDVGSIVDRTIDRTVER